jgi:HAMP domain-containing protein
VDVQESERTHVARELLLGTRVARYELGKIALEQVSPSLSPTLAAIRTGRGGVTTVDLRGRPYLMAYAPIAEVNWHLVMATPLDEITASTAATSARITGIARDTQSLGLLASLIAVVLLGLVISYLLRRQFTRPLAALIRATEAVAGGDLRPIPTASRDEMGQLAASFNVLDARPILERFGLDGRVALVTGGGQGIGRAYAHALGEAGAAVAVVDTIADRARAVADELARKDIDALAVTADVT